MSKAEVKRWYTGETEQQAASAIAAIQDEAARKQPVDYPNLDNPIV